MSSRRAAGGGLARAGTRRGRPGGRAPSRRSPAPLETGTSPPVRARSGRGEAALEEVEQQERRAVGPPVVDARHSPSSSSSRSSRSPVSRSQMPGRVVARALVLEREPLVARRRATSTSRSSDMPSSSRSPTRVARARVDDAQRRVDRGRRARRARGRGASRRPRARRAAKPPSSPLPSRTDSDERWISARAPPSSGRRSAKPSRSLIPAATIPGACASPRSSRAGRPRGTAASRRREKAATSQRPDSSPVSSWNQRTPSPSSVGSPSIRPTGWSVTWRALPVTRSQACTCQTPDSFEA